MNLREVSLTALIDTLQDRSVSGVAGLPGHLLLHLPAGLPAALAPAADTAQGAADRNRGQIVVIITYNVLIMRQINHNLSCMI